MFLLSPLVLQKPEYFTCQLLLKTVYAFKMKLRKKQDVLQISEVIYSTFYTSFIDALDNSVQTLGNSSVGFWWQLYLGCLSGVEGIKA